MGDLGRSVASNAMRYELYEADESERPFLAFASYSDAAGAALAEARNGVAVDIYDVQADEIVSRVRP